MTAKKLLEITVDFGLTLETHLTTPLKEVLEIVYQARVWLGLCGNDRRLLTEIYNLMYRLSATASHISLFHVSHVVLLYAEQPELLFPEHYGTNWKILKRII